MGKTGVGPPPKVVVVGGGSDRWASRTSVYPYILKGYVAFVSRLVPG